MKKRTGILIVLAALYGLCFNSQSALAQASSGSNPQYLFYKYHRGPGGILPATTIGDLIGTIRFRALTASQVARDGAVIQSVISGPAGADSLSASLLFRTGATELITRMAINHDGLVGIGTANPLYNLHTEGNTYTSGNFFGRIHIEDTQGIDAAPSTYGEEAHFELKARSILGLPTGPGGYGTLFTLAPGQNSHDHQMFFADDGLFYRHEDGNATSWAGATWNKLLSNADIIGATNRIARFTAPSTLGSSQLWDDGIQVGIRTTTPVGGFEVDINGNTHIGGKLAIGTEDIPGGHLLYVGGSIIAEEVQVKLAGSWPDYVFRKSFRLKSLSEVEAYIQENKHLPGVKGATEIEEEGLQLGEMQRAQMQKIEEAFLHLIELEKRIEALEHENRKLHEENLSMKKALHEKPGRP